MRQVPHYTIIGNGRLAKHFCHYFKLLDIKFNQWHRKLNTPVIDYLKSSTHVLLLIHDQAIEPFIDQHPILATKILIHCSGCLVTDKAFGAHPLMTCNHSLYTLHQYQQIPFTVDADAPDFASLFPQLNNPHAKLAKANKPLYHALAVLACNFSVMLWKKLFTDFERKLNLPASLAKPLLKQTLLNLLDNPADALTGPLARNDKATINTNLTALSTDAYQQVYQAFVTAYQHSQPKETTTDANHS